METGGHKQNIGQEGELLARQFLKRIGWRILKTNYRLPVGEIDILAMDGKTLVVVEVKSKSDHQFGLPQEEVDARKQRKLINLAALVGQQYPEKPLRIDVIAVDYSFGKPIIEHIPNAVEAL